MNLSHYSNFSVFDLFDILKNSFPQERRFFPGNVAGTSSPARVNSSAKASSSLVRTPLLVRVFSHCPRRGDLYRRSKSVQKSLKTFKTRNVR